MADLQKLVVRLEAETARYQKDLDAARGKLAKFEQSTVASVNKMAKAFGAVVGTALVVLSRDLLKTGDNLAKLSQKTGVSVETLSRLGHAAELSGVDIEALGTSMNKFARFMAEAEMGGQTQKMALDAIGLSVQNLLALSPEDRLIEVAEAISGFEDGAGKAAVAMALFGKTGADMIPFLNEGAAGIRKMAEESDALGNTWDTETAKAFESFNDNIERLHKVGVALARPVLEDLVFYLDAFAIAVLDVDTAAGDAKDEVHELAGEFRELFDIIEAHPRAFSMGLLGGAAFGPAVGGLSAAAGFIMDELDIYKKAAAEAASGDYGPPVPEWMVKRGADFASLDGSGTAAGGKGRISFGDRDAQTAAESAAKAIASNIESLRVQAATIGMTTEQQKLYELATDGASQAQLQQAQAALRSIAIFEEQQQAKKDAVEWEEKIAAIYREMEPLIYGMDYATVKYKDTVAKLNILLQEGALSQAEYEAATKKAAENLDTYANAVREMGLQLQESIKGATSNLFQNLITDAQNWKDHLLNFFGDIADAFAKMAADMAVQSLFGTTGGGGGIDWGAIIGKFVGAAIGGAAGGGSAGGDIGAGFYGGGGGGIYNHTFAAGGWMPANSVSLVGEQGPELIMSRSAARVFSNDETMDMMGGKGGNTLVQNFAVKDFDSFHASRRQVQRTGKVALGIAI